MKKKIFDQYVKEVCELYRFEDESILWTKSKSPQFSNARYLLYFLAFRRGINMADISRYCQEYGFDVPRSNIIHASRKLGKLFEVDVDYSSVIRRIEASVII